MPLRVDNFSAVASEFERHEPTLQGGFALAMVNGDAEASFGAPAPWPLLKAKLPLERCEVGDSDSFYLGTNRVHSGQCAGRRSMV